jgi:hypothetical protein
VDVLSISKVLVWVTNSVIIMTSVTVGSAEHPSVNTPKSQVDLLIRSKYLRKVVQTLLAQHHNNLHSMLVG